MSDPTSSNDIFLQQLTAHLKREKYDCVVVQNYTAAVKRFLQYLDRNRVAVDCVQCADIECYLTALRFCQTYRKRGRVSNGLRKLHRSAIHMLMRVVHGQWPIPQPLITECEVLHSQIIRGYDAWMSDLRGLATETRSDRRAEAGRFLKWLGESGGKNQPAALTIADIDAYVQWRGAPVRRTSRKSITVNLRSFLRHLHFTGIIERDLSTAVIGPTLYAYEDIPSALRAEDVQKVLKVTRRDRSAIGRRDYAILMLLSTYGLRAGEITSLRLEDIDWRRSRVHVRHSKTGVHSLLPLLSGPGEAILEYLRDGRPETGLRELFIRSRAPYRAFASGSSLYTPIRRRLAMAGVTPAGKKGPHAFRHARAVTLLRSKVPLKLIGDVLGHRSTHSTGAYLKLATEDLRRVALEVPTEVQP